MLHWLHLLLLVLISSRTEIEATYLQYSRLEFKYFFSIVKPASFIIFFTAVQLAIDIEAILILIKVASS